MAAVALALVACGVLTVITVNQMKTIERLEDHRESNQSRISALVATSLSQERDIKELKTRPQVNPRQIATILTGLQDEATASVDSLSSTVFGLESRLSDVEYQIERPVGCYANDVVYWASGFGGGFTC